MSSSPPSNSLTLIPTIASPSPITALPAPNNPNPLPIRRGLPPPCWSNEETLALIDSYKEKWYSLNRGNLRAAHWDEVAAAVADKSISIPSATPKTSVQCRHKIEKLRKRYRSEVQKSINHNPMAPFPTSPWLFFKTMDQMENPNRDHSVHLTAIPLNVNYENDFDESENAQFYRRPDVVVSNGGGSSSSSLKFKIPKVGKSVKDNIPMAIPNYGSAYMKAGMDEMRRKFEGKRKREEMYDDEDDNENDELDEGDGVKEMAKAIRTLGEGYLRIEQMKMEMAREMERARMEMELKRTEMILETQRRIMEAFVNGVVRDKKIMRRSSNC